MKLMFKTLLPKTLLLSAVSLACSAVAHAAPRQVILVVAEGLSPQAIEFGRSYVKAGFGNDTDVAFDAVKENAKVANAPADSISQLRGILKTAKQNGWKTGVVTTGDAATVAGLFADAQGQGAALATSVVSGGSLDFIAGGGRASFGADVLKSVTDKGGTAIVDLEGMDAEVKGQTVALAADGELPYHLDRDVEKEPSLSELAALGMDALAEGESPYMLVIHDTLLQKAAQAKDTPAYAEQFREIDTIVADAMGRREADPANVAVGILATGGAVAPQWSTADANERSNASAMLSQLPVSYARAGRDLTGADEAKLKAFAADTYKGWQLSDASRAAITAGTLTPEAAVRASYEPALKIEFATVNAPASFHAVGFEPGADPLATLKGLAAKAPPAATAPVETATP
jgi:hypothetical protein